MSEEIIKNPADVMGYIGKVRQLADANRSALGFLPKSAYTEAAMKGHLWIAIEKSTQELLGYLFFGGRYPHLKVFQVYVRPEFRSAGVAGTLVGALMKYGEETSCLTIRARVASELVANKFWQRSGFRIVRQISEKTKRTINVYDLELEVPSLFGKEPFHNSSNTDSVNQIVYPSRPLLPTPSYVIDLNVFFDAVRQRDEGESAHIFSSAFNNEIRLSVTPEFAKELERRSYNLVNDPVLEFAKTLPTLPEIPAQTLSSLIEDLKRTLSLDHPKTGKWAVNDESDLIHLASCIHHRAYGFVTRDAGILQHTEELHEKYGLRIISPLDLSDSFGEGETYQQQIAVNLDHEEIKVSSLDDGIDAEAESFLSKMGIGETDMTYCLAPGTRQSPRMRLVVQAGEMIVGIGSWDAKIGLARPTEAYLYIDEDAPSSDRAIDHLLESMIHRGNFGKLFSFELRMNPGQMRTREVAIKRGFHPIREEEGNTLQKLRKVCQRGPITTDNWLSFRNDFKEVTDLELSDNMPPHAEMSNTGIILLYEEDKSRPQTVSLFDFETWISPGSLICPGRGAVMIPIQEKYANELLPGTESQTSFLPGKEAALRLERAYFSGVGRHNVIERGAIIVFYISYKRKAAVGLARATFSDKLTTTQAVLNLRRQGVLSEEEISQRGNRKGEVTATTFDNLLLFPRSIPYQDLKQMGCVGGANLVTAQRLSHESLLRVISEAFG